MAAIVEFTMKALKFTEVRRSEIVEVARPIPKAGEVLIKVKAAGICASDVMAFRGEHPYRIPPVITGHELSGEIVESGPAVSTVKTGDRVAVEPHIGCGHCYLCRHGHYNVCLNKRLIGVGDWIGAFSEYVIAAEPMCHAIPDKMTFEEGAALEPLCVGLHAVRRAHMNVGERVAVLGCGTIGLMTLLSAKLSGPELLIATDISPFKREMARKSGADLAIDPLTQDPIEEVLKATDGIGVDTAFVAVEQESVLQQSVRMCKRMGKVVLIASFGGEVAFVPREIQLYERALIGTGMYTRDDYRSAIRLWEKGVLNINSLINQRISLDEAPDMVSALADGKGPDAVKIIIMFE
jgi:2-desacetyl-2-hydroxyethyl bacteriochlorophyllide A dehydrogenase